MHILHIHWVFLRKFRGLVFDSMKQGRRKKGKKEGKSGVEEAIQGKKKKRRET